MTLFRFSVFVVFATLLLIAAGGLFTSHEAGLAVPDWPLSYCQFFPPIVGNVFWEHGHRMIAGTVGILTLILALWVQVAEKREGIKKLAWAALGAVLLQALLGGLTVLFLLPPPISIFHACLAQTFFCLLIAIAFFLSNPGTAVALQEDAGLKRLSILTTSFIYFQLILGAVVRHTGNVVVLHVLMAFLITLHVLLLLIRTLRFHSEEKNLVRVSTGLGVLTILQIFLGLGSFIFTRMLERGFAPSTGEVLFTASHQTIGACVLALSFLMTLWVTK